VFWIGGTHLYLARIDEAQGEHQSAIAHYREALRCLEQVQSPNAEEARTALQRLEAGQIGLAEEEAERAAQDAAFLAEKFGLAADDPNIPAIQEQLRQALAQPRQPRDPEQAALGEALRAFLNTSSWEEMRAVLEREQARLLSERAGQILTMM